MSNHNSIVNDPFHMLITLVLLVAWVRQERFIVKK